MNFILLHVALVATVMVFFPVEGAGTVEFFKYTHHRGLLFAGNITNCCTDFPVGDDQASSVNTHGFCVLVYEHANCRGRVLKVAPGTPYHYDLSKLDFDDIASSYSGC